MLGPLMSIVRNVVTKFLSKFALVFVLALMLPGPRALGECDIEVTVSDVNKKWNNKRSNIVRHQLRATVTNSGGSNKNCDYFITMSSTTYSGTERVLTNESQEQLNVLISTDNKGNNLIKDYSQLSTNDIVTIDNGPFGFWVVAANPDITYGGGTYSDTITISIYEGTTKDNGSLAKQYSFSINVEVPSDVSLSLVNSGAAFDAARTSLSLDFGTLETSETLSFDLVIKANAGYGLSFRSENSGNLKHETEAQLIAYELDISGIGSNLSLSSEQSFSLPAYDTATYQDGFRYPITVRIGDVTNKLSGSYSDFITLTITAQ